ncbi:MAG TPA: SWIM zinc finger family protein [Myxococcaceae bacterium]|nr:SWIM zinc finger family protein [Myxococcaceae bacterium]
MALDTLASLAGGARALAQAEQLAMSDAFSHLRCEDGGPRLTGRWKGSGRAPYRISIELARRPIRHGCTCPSRQRPCKHVLALLARWSRDPDAFERHGQLDAFAVAHAPTPGEVPPPRSLAGETTGDERLACVRRHRGRQAVGLELAEALLVRWVIAGLRHLDAVALRDASKRLEELEGLHLPALAARLRILLQTASAPGRDVDAHAAAVALHLSRAWTLLRRGRTWAEAAAREPAPDDLAGWQEEAALQSALGRRWTPAELKLLGMERDLTLVELAWRRVEDPGLRARIESSLLFDLEGAGWMEERKVTPWARLGHVRPKTSYRDLLKVVGAQRWPVQEGRPDAACPRVRWSAGAARSSPAMPSDWARLVACAQPLSAVGARHAALRARPWHAPIEHPELLQVQSIEQSDGALWLRDPTGERQRLHGPPESVATLTFHGLPRDTRAAVVLVIEGPGVETPTFELLTLITPQGPVRLAG